MDEAGSVRPGQACLGACTWWSARKKQENQVGTQCACHSTTALRMFLCWSHISQESSLGPSVFLTRGCPKAEERPPSRLEKQDPWPYSSTLPPTHTHTPKKHISRVIWPLLTILAWILSPPSQVSNPPGGAAICVNKDWWVYTWETTKQEIKGAVT